MQNSGAKQLSDSSTKYGKFTMVFNKLFPLDLFHLPISINA